MFATKPPPPHIAVVVTWSMVLLLASNATSRQSKMAQKQVKRRALYISGGSCDKDDPIATEKKENRPMLSFAR